MAKRQRDRRCNIMTRTLESADKHALPEMDKGRIKHRVKTI
jgi:hypothetical protein